MDVELLKLIAEWTGWNSVAGLLFAAILAIIFIYTREISIRDQRIGKLKDELEASKAYQYDNVYLRITNNLKTLNEELTAAESESNSKQEHIDKIKHELDKAYSEVRDLRDKLKYFDEQLGDLLEPDYCQVCDVDDDHVMMNTISWGYGGDNLVGDTSLVDKEGVCSYCGSTNLKCKLCGAVTGINFDSSKDTFECEGGCGTFYTLLTFLGDKSMEHTIKVSRMDLESDE
jgi:hypothetical protein